MQSGKLSAFLYQSKKHTKKVHNNIIESIKSIIQKMDTILRTRKIAELLNIMF